MSSPSPSHSYNLRRTRPTTTPSRTNVVARGAMDGGDTPSAQRPASTGGAVPAHRSRLLTSNYDDTPPPTPHTPSARARRSHSRILSAKALPPAAQPTTTSDSNSRREIPSTPNSSKDPTIAHPQAAPSPFPSSRTRAASRKAQMPQFAVAHHPLSSSRDAAVSKSSATRSRKAKNAATMPIPIEPAVTPSPVAHRQTVNDGDNKIAAFQAHQGSLESQDTGFKLSSKAQDQSKNPSTVAGKNSPQATPSVSPPCAIRTVEQPSAPNPVLRTHVPADPATYEQPADGSTGRCMSETRTSSGLSGLVQQREKFLHEQTPSSEARACSNDSSPWLERDAKGDLQNHCQVFAPTTLVFDGVVSLRNDHETVPVGTINRNSGEDFSVALDHCVGHDLKANGRIHPKSLSPTAADSPSASGCRADSVLQLGCVQLSDQIINTQSPQLNISNGLSKPKDDVNDAWKPACNQDTRCFAELSNVFDECPVLSEEAHVPSDILRAAVSSGSNFRASLVETESKSVNTNVPPMILPTENTGICQNETKQRYVPSEPSSSEEADLIASPTPPEPFEVTRPKLSEGKIESTEKEVSPSKYPTIDKDNGFGDDPVDACVSSIAEPSTDTNVVHAMPEQALVSDFCGAGPGAAEQSGDSSVHLTTLSAPGTVRPTIGIGAIRSPGRHWDDELMKESMDNESQRGCNSASYSDSADRNRSYELVTRSSVDRSQPSLAVEVVTQACLNQAKVYIASCLNISGACPPPYDNAVSDCNETDIHSIQAIEKVCDPDPIKNVHVAPEADSVLVLSRSLPQSMFPSVVAESLSMSHQQHCTGSIEDGGGPKGDGVENLVQAREKVTNDDTGQIMAPPVSTPMETFSEPAVGEKDFIKECNSEADPLNVNMNSTCEQKSSNGHSSHPETAIPSNETARDIIRSDPAEACNAVDKKSFSSSRICCAVNFAHSNQDKMSASSRHEDCQAPDAIGEEKGHVSNSEELDAFTKQVASVPVTFREGEGSSKTIEAQKSALVDSCQEAPGASSCRHGQLFIPDGSSHDGTGVVAMYQDIPPECLALKVACHSSQSLASHLRSEQSIHTEDKMYGNNIHLENPVSDDSPPATDISPSTDMVGKENTVVARHDLDTFQGALKIEGEIPFAAIVPVGGGLLDTPNDIVQTYHQSCGSALIVGQPELDICQTTSEESNEMSEDTRFAVQGLHCLHPISSAVDVQDSHVVLGTPAREQAAHEANFSAEPRRPDCMGHANISQLVAAIAKPSVCVHDRNKDEVCLVDRRGGGVPENDFCGDTLNTPSNDEDHWTRTQATICDALSIGGVSALGKTEVCDLEIDVNTHTSEDTPDEIVDKRSKIGSDFNHLDSSHTIEGASDHDSYDIQPSSDCEVVELNDFEPSDNILAEQSDSSPRIGSCAPVDAKYDEDKKSLDDQESFPHGEVDHRNGSFNSSSDSHARHFEYTSDRAADEDWSNLDEVDGEHRNSDESSSRDWDVDEGTHFVNDGRLLTREPRRMDQASWNTSDDVDSSDKITSSNSDGDQISSEVVIVRDVAHDVARTKDPVPRKSVELQSEILSQVHPDKSAEEKGMERLAEDKERTNGSKLSQQVYEEVDMEVRETFSNRRRLDASIETLETSQMAVDMLPNVDAESITNSKFSRLPHMKTFAEIVPVVSQQGDDRPRPIGKISKNSDKPANKQVRVMSQHKDDIPHPVGEISKNSSSYFANCEPAYGSIRVGNISGSEGACLSLRENVYELPTPARTIAKLRKECRTEKSAAELASRENDPERRSLLLRLDRLEASKSKSACTAPDARWSKPALANKHSSQLTRRRFWSEIEAERVPVVHCRVLKVEAGRSWDVEALAEQTSAHVANLVNSLASLNETPPVKRRRFDSSHQAN